MLLDTLVCSTWKLSQTFPIDKGLIRHYLSNSDAATHHGRKLLSGYSSVGAEYAITNKKLKDSLEEFDELLEKYTVTKTCYLSSSTIQVLFNNGVLVYITVDNGNLTAVTLNRTLSKGLYGQITFDGHITSTFMILICSGKLCVSTNADTSAAFDNIFQYKIVNLETEFCYVTHLSVAHNMILLWTTEGHMVIYSPIGPGIRELCRYNTPYRLCAAQFNPTNSTIMTCQLKASSQGNVFHALSFTYDISGKGSKARIVEVLKHRITHLRADVVTAKYNHSTTKLLLGLSTGKIFLHCQLQKRNFTTEVTVTQHITTSFSWHPSDTFLVVVLRSGYIQIYDETLQPIKTSFGGFPDTDLIDTNRIFSNVRNVSSIEVSHDHIAVIVERGPLLSMQILLPNTETESDYFSKLLHSYFYRREYRAGARLLRNCLHRFKSETHLLAITKQLIHDLTTIEFNEHVFAIGAEVLLQLKKEKNISEKGRGVLHSLAMRLILKALHNKHYREALKLARKLDNEDMIGKVDSYVKFCGLSVTCKSPDQIKLSRKPSKTVDT